MLIGWLNTYFRNDLNLHIYVCVVSVWVVEMGEVVTVFESRGVGMVESSSRG